MWQVLRYGPGGMCRGTGRLRVWRHGTAGGRLVLGDGRRDCAQNSSTAVQACRMRSHRRLLAADCAGCKGQAA